MKRGGLGGTILLAAAAVVAVLLALDREPAPRSPPRALPPAPAPAPAEPDPVPPEPPRIAVAEPAERKPGARLVGRVTDEDGRPIEGAELLLAERDLSGEIVARTDEDGRYLADGVQGKDLLLGAIAKGHAPSDLVPLGVAERPVLETDFTLRRGGGSLSLVVRAADGGAPEAVVIVKPFFEEEGVERGGKRDLLAQGGVTVEGLMPEWNRVYVLARGYAPVFLPVRLNPGGPVEVTVPLAAGATLKGTVRTPDGAPVPEALVRPVVWPARCFARTGADGSFLLEHLPTGRVEMEAEGGGGQAWAVLDLEDGKEASWDPVLRPPAVLAGRVLEEDGSPVAGASVWVSWVSVTESAGFDLETGDDGGFRVENCREGTYRVAVRRRGATGAPAAEITATPRDSPVTITLRRGEGFVRGTVVDRKGAPAARAAIRIWPAAWPDSERRAGAAADGSFRLGPFPPGPYFVELHLDGEPTLHLRPAIEVVAGETRDLGVLRFGAGGRVRARVLDLLGAVLPQERIDVLSLDGSIRYAGEQDDGAFLSEELAPGSYLVRGRCHIEEVRVETGAVATIDLRMRPGGTLRLVTVLADGSPGSAICSIKDAKGRPLGSYGSNGTPYLAAGDYRVLAADSHGRRADAPVRMGHEDQTVILVLE